MSSKRARLTNPFVDLEAQVDQEEEESDTEGDDDEAFIVQDEEPSSQTSSPRLPQRTELEPVGDLDELAQDIIRRNARGKAREAAEVGPSLMWMIRVPRRSEDDIMVQLFATGKIPSMRTSSRLPGRIYAEAPNRQAVADACKGLRVMSYAPIPFEDWNQHRGSGGRQPQDEPLSTGSWARVRRAHPYTGDLAYVLKVAQTSDIITMAVVPRIDYAPFGTKRKGKMHVPEPELFDPERVKLIYGMGAVVERENDSEYSFRGTIYRRGLAIISILSTHTLTRELQPRLQELAPFKKAIIVDDNIDKHLLAASMHFWREGDRLRVIEGEFHGVRGNLSCVDFHLRSATIKITCKVTTDGEVVDIPQETLDIPLGHLRRLFIQGDGVRVVAGDHRGLHGIVFACLDEEVTFFETQSRTLLKARVEFFETHDPDITHAAGAGTGLPGRVIRTEPRNPLIGKRVVVVKGHHKGFLGYVTEVGNKGVVVNFPQRYTSDQTFPMSHLAQEMVPFTLDGTPTSAHIPPPPPPPARVMTPTRELTPPPDGQALSSAWDPAADRPATSDPLGSGAFLYDWDLCHNVGQHRIVVRFRIDFEQGRQYGRLARTQLPTRFDGPTGPAGDGEVALVWTDNRAITRNANVHVKFLEPANPTSKGTRGLVLNGDHRGEVVQVHRVNKKAQKLVVQPINGSSSGVTWEESQQNICQLDQA